MVQPLWEKDLAISYKSENISTPRPINSTSRYIPQRHENIRTGHKELHTNVHTSSIHNSQKVKTVPINERMGK